MQEQETPGHLRYSIDAELQDLGVVRYGTDFTPEGRVLIRHLKKQGWLETGAYWIWRRIASAPVATRVLSRSSGNYAMKSAS